MYVIAYQVYYVYMYMPVLVSFLLFNRQLKLYRSSIVYVYTCFSVIVSNYLALQFKWHSS